MVSLYVPWSYWFPAEVHFANAQSMIQQHEVLYLPDLQPMGSDSPPAPPDSRREETKKDEAPASSSSPKAVQGVVYTGPQLIISNPPHPDNFVQTILQPDLPLRPKLPAPLQMPPMVSIAPAKPILAPPAPQPAPEAPPQKQPVQLAAAEPILLPSQQPKVEAPKLPLPAAELNGRAAYGRERRSSCNDADPGAPEAGHKKWKRSAQHFGGQCSTRPQR